MMVIDKVASMKAPVADDLCSTAAPSPLLTVGLGKLPEHEEGSDSGFEDFALPNAEESEEESDDESAAGAAFALSVRRYVLTGAISVPPRKLEVVSSTKEQDDLDDDENEVLRFRLSVRKYAEQCALQL